MNLGITNPINNYSIGNKYNAKPSFGMAIKVDSSANNIIKKQVVKMSEKKANKFWTKLNKIIEDQKENPINIIIRKHKHKKKLTAEIIDNQNNTKKGKNKKFSQGIFSKNGSLKFLKKAEKHANKLNNTNTKISELPKVTE